MQVARCVRCAVVNLGSLTRTLGTPYSLNVGPPVLASSFFLVPSLIFARASSPQRLCPRFRRYLVLSASEPSMLLWYKSDCFLAFPISGLYFSLSRVKSVLALRPFTSQFSEFCFALPLFVQV